MDKLKEMWERLPKWAKLGLPILLVAIVAYIYIKDKGSSSSSSSSTEPADGTTDVAVGASTSPSGTTTQTTPAGPVPTITPAAAPKSKQWDALANHWAQQAVLNAKREGKSGPTNVTKIGPNATKAQAKAAYEHNKTVATTIAHTNVVARSKSRSVPAVHSVAANKAKESPKKKTA